MNKYMCSIPYLFTGMLLVLSGCRKPINLTCAKNKIEAYYDSGKFDKELNQVISSARTYFKHRCVGKQDTVVFDIDDTVLSTYSDMKSIHFGYIPKLSHLWILEGDAPALVPVREFYNYLVSCGYRIVFLTGRRHNEYEATEKNLHEQGFAVYDRLIIRTQEEEHLSAYDYKKNRRKQLVDEGFVIIASVGDQWSDLQGGHAGKQIKIPNYTYIID